MLTIISIPTLYYVVLTLFEHAGDIAMRIVTMIYIENCIEIISS